MKVSPAEPFQIIYSLFQHEYLGYLFESFVVKLGENDRLTLQHQNISSKNAKEFKHQLDEADFKLIEIMDSMQQESVVKYFSKKQSKATPFFLKVFDKNKPEKILQTEIDAYLERRRADVLSKIANKRLFEMGNDGEPTWREIEIQNNAAKVLFHFRRNEDNTHYFPTIKHGDEKVFFQYNDSYLVCKKPAWLIAKNKLYHFEGNVDGNKIAPFLTKRFIVIPQNIEETYYEKFVTPLVASYDVFAKGFDIQTKRYTPVPILYFSSFESGNQKTLEMAEPQEESQIRILFELKFKYGNYQFKSNSEGPVSVKMEKENDTYIFYRIKRDKSFESSSIKYLREINLPLQHSRKSLDQSAAFSWLNNYRSQLEKNGFVIQQKNVNGKKYFLGDASINIEIKENIDWFDIYAIVKFGDFEIPFNQLRKQVMRNIFEIKLPNGEIAVIPEEWFHEYKEFFAFMEEDDSGHRLKKHHLALVKDLEEGSFAKVSIDRKLNSLRNFEEIDSSLMPADFKGELRPYQKAGYDWLKFLSAYKFGGCLADDMGLGKTVQTLAMLQAEKEAGSGPNLLIMPTSLVYNWEMEAAKFTPKLKVLAYTGTLRNKDAANFAGYDLILTSYGITRLDIDLLSEFYFNYVILDESQAIKNPTSNIASAVKKLQSRYRLILTGTPLENSTMDLWSQMNFINPGLLGAQKYFTNEFLKPIENHRDERKTRKLHSIIKPFILRRNKAQVLKELPDKVENVHYSTMTEEQQEKYEEVKTYYRNQILSKIETEGVKSSQMILLQGLTKLRQLANHPKLLDPEYAGSSGKMDDIQHMLKSTIAEGHKILIFSQFVKHLSVLRDWLDVEQLDYAYLDGKTRDRKAQVENFQNDPDLHLFLISLKAGGLGLNLTKADYVFILDPWWNPAAEAQAIDRAHRIGQKNTVFSYKFITKNTVEEKILALQKRKLRLVGDLIQEEAGVLKSLSKEDISELLN